MDKIERDDFVYALEQTMKFYGKELDRMQVTFWVDACSDRSPEKLKLALREHIKSGRYAPRPAEILSLADTMTPQRRQSIAIEAPAETQCPPETAKAWMWFIGRVASSSITLGGLFSQSSDIDVETQEKYLHIVNHEAHKYGTPEAIPDEYRLQEVWG